MRIVHAISLRAHMASPLLLRLGIPMWSERAHERATLSLIVPYRAEHILFCLLSPRSTALRRV